MEIFVRALISWLGLVFLDHSHDGFFHNLQPRFREVACPWDEDWYFDRQSETWKIFDSIPF